MLVEEDFKLLYVEPMHLDVTFSVLFFFSLLILKCADILLCSKLQTEVPPPAIMSRYVTLTTQSSNSGNTNPSKPQNGLSAFFFGYNG